MGYSIYQIETEFFIQSKFKSEALFSIKNLVKKLAENETEIAFVQTPEIEQATELESALTALRWMSENNERGDIIEINSRAKN
jgi:predicted deacetylase